MVVMSPPPSNTDQAFAFNNPNTPARFHLEFGTDMSSTNYHNFFGVLSDQTSFESAIVKLRFRGFRRRNECTIIPLEVDLLGQLQFFSTARSFDLITHCHQVSLEYNNAAVLVEFWQHRLAQLLLKRAMNVQLVEMTYTNSHDETNYEGLGILRESKRQMAARLKMKPIPKKASLSLQPVNISYNMDWLRTELFEILTGNTIDRDFRTLKNFVGLESSDGPIFIPYDFNMSTWISPDPLMFVRAEIQSIAAVQLYCAHQYWTDSDCSRAAADALKIVAEQKNAIKILKEMILKSREASKYPISKSASDYIDQYFDLVEPLLFHTLRDNLNDLKELLLSEISPPGRAMAYDDAAIALIAKSRNLRELKEVMQSLKINIVRTPVFNFINNMSHRTFSYFFSHLKHFSLSRTEAKEFQNWINQEVERDISANSAPWSSYKKTFEAELMRVVAEHPPDWKGNTKLSR